MTSGVDPTKLFFFVNEEFFCFSLLSLAVVQYTDFFHMLQTIKVNSENRKTGKNESLFGSTPGLYFKFEKKSKTTPTCHRICYFFFWHGDHSSSN